MNVFNYLETNRIAQSQTPAYERLRSSIFCPACASFRPRKNFHNWLPVARILGSLRFLPRFDRFDKTAAAQFIVGLALLEGHGVERNESSAYYWLRMAEENSSAVRQRCRALTEDLRAKINPGEIEALESSVATGASKEEILGRKPVDFFKKHLSSMMPSDRQAS